MERKEAEEKGQCGQFGWTEEWSVPDGYRIQERNHSNEAQRIEKSPIGKFSYWEGAAANAIKASVSLGYGLVALGLILLAIRCRLGFDR